MSSRRITSPSALTVATLVSILSAACGGSSGSPQASHHASTKVDGGVAVVSMKLEPRVTDLAPGQRRVELRQEDGTVVFFADIKSGSDSAQHLLYTLLPNHAISDLKDVVSNDLPLHMQAALSPSAAVTATELVYQQVVQAIRGNYDNVGCDMIGQYVTIESCGNHGGCCDNHDYCYFTRRDAQGNRCNYLSWLPMGLQQTLGNSYNPDCSDCNSEVVRCSLSNAPEDNGPSYCCDPANGHPCGEPRGDTFDLSPPQMADAAVRMVDPAADPDMMAGGPGAADPNASAPGTNMNPVDPASAMDPSASAPAASASVPTTTTTTTPSASTPTPTASAPPPSSSVPPTSASAPNTSTPPMTASSSTPGMTPANPQDPEGDPRMRIPDSDDNDGRPGSTPNTPDYPPGTDPNYPPDSDPWGGSYNPFGDSEFGAPSDSGY